MSKFSPRQALNKAFLKVKPHRSEIQSFKTSLKTLLAQINQEESEEFHKNLIADFLKNTYYRENYFINTKGRNDLVIHTGETPESSVGVILEFKKPTNKSEMLTVDDLNRKALHELVLYFLRDRITNNNLEIKYLIATNIYEWFIFDASLFETAFVQNQTFLKQFKDFEAGRLTSKKTEFFYSEIAQPAIAAIESSGIPFVNPPSIPPWEGGAENGRGIEYTHFDIRDYGEILQDPEKPDDRQPIALFKLLSPEHLLKLPFANDSNSLDKGFYHELLHIIGLTETKQKNKKVIQRQKSGQRNSGSLIENAIGQLDDLDKLSRLDNPEQFGDSELERLFNLGLELAITWMNRILFLKLLEAQLIRYHKNDLSFGFLNLGTVKNYDDLNTLFFSVLARKPGERSDRLQEIFSHVPYLNSSLFEPTEMEQKTIVISNLRDENLPIFAATVLKDSNGKKRTGEINALEYLFEFLNAYDFSSEGSEEIQEENKGLINAAVLGLIFEKINGYKDGSFFTPGFITMYMCRETIRRAVVQKFNQVKGWNCQDIDDLYDRISDKPEANQIINSLKICDPAVGSGHFLVSALNETIAIKSELKILLDRQGKTLRDYHVEVVNDELVVIDDDGLLFEYRPKSQESQRVQETLFHEKQTIIENCLFGVDINPNSVKICRLRLWIELLKNAYYKPSPLTPLPVGEGNMEYGELETLPNIDINIKCGNSLISRFALDADLRVALKQKQYSIENYREAVETYRHAENKQQKREMERLINEIKGNFQTTLQGVDPKKTKLRRLEGEIFNLEGQISLFEETKAEKKKREKKITKLSNQIDKLRVEIEEIESGKIYQNALEWRFEFPEVLNDRGDFIGFDVTIGNPPYIRQEEIKQFKPFFQARYQCYTGIADLFVYFYDRGLELLKEGGHLTYISSNKYFRAGYGQKLRQLLTETTTIANLIDFGDYPVFEEAIAYPSIITLSKVRSNENQLQALSWDATKHKNIEQFATILHQEGFSISQNNLKSDGWRLESPEVLDLLAKLQKTGTPLGEYVNGRFYYGIKTGFNQAFVVDRPTRDRLIQEHPSSAEVLKPFLRGRDVKRWSVEYQDLWLIFTRRGIDLKKYPAIENYLTQYKERLTPGTGRKAGSYKWYEIQDNIAYWQEFETPKIIYQEIATYQAFAWDDTGVYSNNKTFLIPDATYYLLGILNSKIIWFFLDYTVGKMAGGTYAMQTPYVSQIPIANATEPQKALLEKLVDQILKAKKTNPQADITALEAEIDRLVYQLYELTEAEIKIVESST